MRFRFREVERNIERENVNQTVKKEEELGFKQIKPEHEHTMKEMEDFWRSEFARVAEEARES